MRRGTGGSRLRATIGSIAVVLAAAAIPAAVAAPAGADLHIELGVSKNLTVNFPRVPSGATVTLAGPSFIAGFEVSLINLDPGGGTVRFQLAEGLRWGTSAPAASDGCTNTGSGAECTITTRHPVLGESTVGLGWDVVAERSGSYVLRAEIVETTAPPDPNPADNSAAVTVVVTEASSGGSGGTGSSVSAGAVKITPARPSAGSAVAATVRVTANGRPARPTGVSCRGTLAGVATRGTPRAAAGSASCVYRTPRSARGKRLRGTVSFTARGVRFTKRFSVRLG